MAGGLGAAGFGAGFGRGLMNVLMQNRQDKAEKKAKEFQALLPIHLQLAQETGDYSGLENLIGTFDPDLAATLKKHSPFQQLHQFMGPQLQMSAEQPPMSNAEPQTGLGGLALPPAEPPPPGTTPQVPPLPSRTVATQPLPGTAAPPAGSAFFGSPVLTPTQRAQQNAEANVAAEKLSIQARRDLALKMGMTPDRAMDYALYGTRPPQEARQSAEPFQSVAGEDAKGNPKFGVFDQTRGVYLDPITREPIPGFHQRTPTTGGAQSEFETFLVAYAKDHNKTVDQLSVKERLDARSEYAKAGSTAQPKPEEKDPMALARLAVRQPQVLQGLTPTVTSGVMAAIASDPQLSAQYEFTRMEPIRSQAQSAVNAMKDLVVVDKNTGEVKGLTPGAAGLYGVGAGRLARFYPGSQTATAKAALDQITGELTLDMLKEMKAQSRTGATGFGQLSGRELDVLQSAATVLKGEISPERALQELKKLYERFNKVLLPGESEMLASAGQPAVGPITLDTPVFIGPDGKPRIGGK